MSARKLSRFAGLVFVLAAFLGGVGAAAEGAKHGTGGSTDSAAVTVAPAFGPDIIWG
jgi:hypothetical protein